MRSRTLLVLVSLATGLNACASDRQATRPSAMLLRPAGSLPWTEDFGDRELRDLLDRADLSNLDIKSALARLEAATADEDKAKAGRSPVVQVGMAGAVGGETFGRARTAASPTLEATYAADLWGRRLSAITAAASEQSAAVAEVEEARRAVAAETSHVYLALRADEAAVSSADRRLGLARRQAELMAVRLREGSADAQAAATANDAFVQAQIGQTLAVSEVASDARRLALLVGVTDPIVPAPGFLPDAGPRDPSSVSSTVVDRLPMVAAAYARLQAADARRAEAAAAMRPDFQIVAALGAPDAAVATLLDVKALAWALAGVLTQTVIDGGARKADLARASAETDVAELAWRAAVLRGWSDLQGALADEARARSRLELAQRGAALASAALEVARRRHDAGVIDGVGLVQAQIADEDGLAAVTQARKALLDTLIVRRLAEPPHG